MQIDHVTHFYLQLTARNLPPTLQSLSQLPPFNKTGVHIADVHKTGLGSSAALITSLVSGLLLHLNVIAADSFATEGGTASASEGRKLAHNLAQYVHCLAQGKVGSGFDVSAAVFGSQLYTRFDPAVIEPLMSENLVSQNHIGIMLGTDHPVGFAGKPSTSPHHFSFKFCMGLPRRALQASATDAPHARGCGCRQ